MNEYFPFIVPAIFMIIMAVTFGEMAVSGLWLPAYFRYGIPLFRKEYPLATMPDLAAKIPELEQKLKRTMWRPSVVFRALNENEIAFRSNFNSRNKMSGLILLEPSQGRMRISGNLYWMFLMLPFLFIFLGIMSQSIVLMVFMTAIILVNIVVQRNHYGQIAAVIAETAISAQPADWQPPEPIEYAPKTTEYAPKTTEYAPKTYQPVYYDPNAAKPSTGLTTLEIVLIVVLAALIVVGLVLGFLFFL